LFYYHPAGERPDLPPFPTRRSSDLDKVRRAVALLHEREPALQVDGEMQADTAVVERILTKTYPFAKLRSPANVLIFPDLDAANRSEEHTSELQSRGHLVCRLLLEKK